MKEKFAAKVQEKRFCWKRTKKEELVTKVQKGNY
jgi:hypothetical protein